MDEIIDEFLWIGSIYDYGDHEKLHRLGITHILDLARESTPHCNMDKIKSEFNYYHIEMYDSPEFPIYKYFDETEKYLDEIYNSGGKVLVNCHMGRSRSATIVINYIMRKTGLMMGVAMMEVKNKRNAISPNIGFMKQLEVYNFLKDLTEEI
jgi:protein-tyrosine phosphatase